MIASVLALLGAAALFAVCLSCLSCLKTAKWSGQGEAAGKRKDERGAAKASATGGELSPDIAGETGQPAREDTSDPDGASGAAAPSAAAAAPSDSCSGGGTDSDGASEPAGVESGHGSCDESAVSPKEAVTPQPREHLARAVLCAAGVALAGGALIWVLPVSRSPAALRALLSFVILLTALRTDRRTHTIPNRLVLTYFAAGAFTLAEDLILGRVLTGVWSFASLWLALIGVAVCFLTFYLPARLTKGGVGMGDVKLAAALGFSEGASRALLTMLFGLIFCAVWGGVLLLRKKSGRRDRLPFGPFLFAGYLATLALDVLSTVLSA